MFTSRQFNRDLEKRPIVTLTFGKSQSQNAQNGKETHFYYKTEEAYADYYFAFPPLRQTVVCPTYKNKSEKEQNWRVVHKARVSKHAMTVNLKK